MVAIEPTTSLYDLVGGADAIDPMVDDFYDRIVADPFLAPVFAHTTMERLREMQKSFIGAALGGPGRYAGVELSTAHAGRGITAAHFSAFAGHLIDAMEAAGVPEDVVQRVIDRLAIYATDVVGGYGEEG